MLAYQTKTAGRELAKYYLYHLRQSAKGLSDAIVHFSQVGDSSIPALQMISCITDALQTFFVF
jgi:hypothetical protein